MTQPRNATRNSITVARPKRKRLLQKPLLQQMRNSQQTSLYQMEFKGHLQGNGQLCRQCNQTKRWPMKVNSQRAQLKLVQATKNSPRKAPTDNQQTAGIHPCDRKHKPRRRHHLVALQLKKLNCRNNYKSLRYPIAPAKSTAS